MTLQGHVSVSEGGLVEWIDEGVVEVTEPGFGSQSGVGWSIRWMSPFSHPFALVCVCFNH